MMRKLAKLVAVIGLAAFLLAPAVMAQDKGAQEPKKDDKKEEKSQFVGKWSVTIAAPGQDLTGTMIINKEGDKYTGSVLTALGEAPLSNIKIDRNKLTADISVNAQGQEMDGTLSGTLEAEALKGDINLPGFPPISYSGKKV